MIGTSWIRKLKLKEVINITQGQRWIGDSDSEDCLTAEYSSLVVAPHCIKNHIRQRGTVNSQPYPHTNSSSEHTDTSISVGPGGMVKG